MLRTVRASGPAGQDAGVGGIWEHQGTDARATAKQGYSVVDQTESRMRDTAGCGGNSKLGLRVQGIVW